MTEFKVGQKVEYIGGECPVEKGTVCVIDGLRDDGYNYHTQDNDHSCWEPAENFRALEGANMYEKGQILESDGRSYTLEVLETLGEVVFTKDSSNNEAALWTADELEKNGWELKEEPETKELTIDEIAKKFKLKPEQVRIKKQD